jgi:hypothetical protein
MAHQYGAVNSYFVPGFGISRTIIQSEIRYFCGPDAIVRPYTHQVLPLHDEMNMILILTGSRRLSCHYGWSATDKGILAVLLNVKAFLTLLRNKSMISRTLPESMRNDRQNGLRKSQTTGLSTSRLQSDTELEEIDLGNEFGIFWKSFLSAVWFFTLKAFVQSLLHRQASMEDCSFFEVGSQPAKSIRQADVERIRSRYRLVYIPTYTWKPILHLTGRVFFSCYYHGYIPGNLVIHCKCCT